MASTQEQESRERTPEPIHPLLPMPEPAATLGQVRAIVASSRPPKHLRKRGNRGAIICICISLSLLFTAWRLLPAPAPSEVTITITPRQQSITQDVALIALPGTVQVGQIQARFVTGSSTVSTPIPVATTGSKNIPQLVAGGWITFYSLASTTRTVSLATILTASNGVQVRTLAQAVIPPASGNPLLMGQATVPAQATQAGSVGNLPAGAILTTCCSADGLITARNLQPFAGGQDGKTYLFVQQGDIDRQTALLEPEALQAAQAALDRKKATDERAVPGSQHCQSAVQANPPVGSTGATVRVRVSITCQQEVYQYAQARQLAIQDYISVSGRQLGPSFALTALPQVEEPLIANQRGQTGELLLTFAISGRWRYQIDHTMLARLLTHLVGKPWPQARAFLLAQPGIAGTSERGASVLPTDPQAIHLAL